MLTAVFASHAKPITIRMKSSLRTMIVRPSAMPPPPTENSGDSSIEKVTT